MRWSLLLACFPVREKLCSNDLRLGESELLNECGDLFLIALAAFDGIYFDVNVLIQIDADRKSTRLNSSHQI